MRHEIERLEALNEELTDLYNKHMRSWADKYNALEAENERLKSKSDAQYLRYKRLLNGINAVITMADDPEKVSEIIKNSMTINIKGGK